MIKHNLHAHNRLNSDNSIVYISGYGNLKGVWHISTYLQDYCDRIVKPLLYGILPVFKFELF